MPGLLRAYSTVWETLQKLIIAKVTICGKSSMTRRSWLVTIRSYKRAHKKGTISSSRRLNWETDYGKGLALKGTEQQAGLYLQGKEKSFGFLNICTTKRLNYIWHKSGVSWVRFKTKADGGEGRPRPAWASKSYNLEKELYSRGTGTLGTEEEGLESPWLPWDTHLELH